MPRTDAEPTPRVRGRAQSADYQEALERAGTTLATSLDELAQCQRTLAQLVDVRTNRVWTDPEHDSYLRLRRNRTELQQRVLRAQRTFDFARNGLRDHARGTLRPDGDPA